ncbi:ATP-binding protein [Ancylobacter sp. VNQ12]|uniref:ATP-binding protein n=1 Tax=Ancylobacter sp. VNQ12 TaxID=3400920 RepID=UPI003C109571
MSIREIDLRLPNELSQIEPLMAALDEFVEANDVPARAAGQLLLAVDEFLANAVEHGYPDGRRGEIGVHLAYAGDHVELVLSDDGDPFDPFTAPPPDLTGSIEERRIGGLGIHLVRNFARSCVYRFEHGRNVVTLTFALQDSTAR